jgi:hypothetical protein
MHTNSADGRHGVGTIVLRQHAMRYSGALNASQWRVIGVRLPCPCHHKKSPRIHTRGDFAFPEGSALQFGMAPAAAIQPAHTSGAPWPITLLLRPSASSADVP